MFCNQCGQKNTDEAKFCCNCGNKLENIDIHISPPTQMQKEASQPIINQIKLWNPNAAANWSLLFTPIFGSYLQMKNWQTLGNTIEANNARNWLIFSIAFILFINLGTPFIWDDPVKLNTYPKSLGLLYIIIWYFSFARIQPKYVKEKLNDRYQKKSWSVPLITSTVVLFISVTIFMIIGDVIIQSLQNQKQPEQTTNQPNYFDKFDKNANQAATSFQNNTPEPTQAELEKKHYDAIFSAHPDAKSIVESKEFENWVYNQSTEWKNYYINVAKEGSSTQVIEMLDDYKKGINH